MEQDRQQIQVTFDDVAKRYDNDRRMLIPGFDDFYGVATSLIQSSSRPSVLDLGAGTGLLSSFIARKLPEAELTLIDLSEGMLEIAKQRFRGRAHISFITADYTKYEYPQQYDFVVSSLSIHHLTAEEKQQLYRRIYSLLNKNGIFVNADQVLGETAYVEQLYKSEWKNFVENSGLSRASIDAAYERTKLDCMDTLGQQLDWLRKSGFTDVDCMYKRYSFTVMFARK